MKKSFNTNPVRRLLIPTDFSPDALNALRYGVQFGKVLKSKITLFHATHVPVVSSAEMAMAASMIDDKIQAQLEMDAIKSKLIDEFAYQNIDVLIKTGFAVDEINKLSRDESMDMIIIG